MSKADRVGSTRPSEAKLEQAFLSNPSRAKDMASDCLCSLETLTFRWLGEVVQESHNERRSPAIHRERRSVVNVAVAFACALPDRGGAQRTHLGSMANSVQAATVLKKTAMARHRTRHRAQRVRAASGTCLTVGMRLLIWNLSLVLASQVATYVALNGLQ